MGLQVKKNANGWHLILWQRGQPSKFIRQSEWPGGLRADMTYAQAQDLIRSLRPLKEVRARQRVARDQHIQSAFLPTDAVAAFEASWFAAKTGAAKAAAVWQWKAAQKAIAAVPIHPSDWLLRPKAFHDYFIRLKKSPDWSKRVIHCMNTYGHIFCRVRSAPFTPLPYPKKTWDYDRRQKSDRLTLLEIADLASVLSEREWNWVWVCFWFGLRPGEVALFAEYPSEVCYVDGDVLVLDQPKLKDKLPELRFRLKRIPIKYPEQQEALEMALAGAITCPDRRTVEAVFPPRVTLYGCRHGFASIMEQRGNALDAVSSWLGHTHLSTTESHYKDRTIVKR